MNTTNPNYSMKREELENRINDAADGLLTEAELNGLELALQSYPDLKSQYKEIMALPDLSNLYGNTHSYRNDVTLARIFESIEQEETTKLSFEHITIDLFRKYALAASLLILAGISIFSVSNSNYLSDEMALEEVLYPEEQSNADEYVLYLDNVIEP